MRVRCYHHGWAGPPINHIIYSLPVRANAHGTRARSPPLAKVNRFDLKNTCILNCATMFFFGWCVINFRPYRGFVLVAFSIEHAKEEPPSLAIFGTHLNTPCVRACVLASRVHSFFCVCCCAVLVCVYSQSLHVSSSCVPFAGILNFLYTMRVV